MRLLIIKPKEGIRLAGRLASKRKALQTNRGTFFLDGKGKWVHTGYRGWINVRKAPGDLVVAETKTKVPDEEWKILTAFLGFLDRHFREDVNWVMIQYVGEE